MREGGQASAEGRGAHLVHADLDLVGDDHDPDGLRGPLGHPVLEGVCQPALHVMDEIVEVGRPAERLAVVPADGGGGVTWRGMT